MADSGRPSDNADKMLLRLPSGMRERIAELAKANGRSANAEVVARLEKSLDEDGDFRLMQQMLAEHEDRIEQLEKRLIRIGMNMDIIAEHAGVPTARDRK